ncbi:MAG TPA: type IV secretory system conjugative DNA transfer family protein [Oligoflexia bacterium]|nr:type IV secretory system conjugative DNA transfer family protein [Oligoflexia bacterium]HMP49602.1 type IV secretory system conjugative DNA transfer family protein [Oligoflexia bacterium]
MESIGLVGGVILLLILIYWQVSRKGAKSALIGYLFFGLLCVLLLIGLDTISSDNEKSSDSSSVYSSGALDSLEHRIKDAGKTRAGLDTYEVEDGDGFLSLDNVTIIGIVCAVLVLGIILLRTFPDLFGGFDIGAFFRKSSDWIRPKRSLTNELGSSDLATAAQIKKWLKGAGKYDTILPVSDLRGSSGQVVKEGHIVIPSGERNRHMLIIAKTGSGKTTKLVLPILYNDCLCPDRSTIVIDSKQEMWHKLAGMTQKYNPHKKIVLFNPLDTIRSLSWNILAKVESDTDCKLIANSVIMATDEPSSKQDSPFFRNSALQVLNAVMVGLLHDPNEILSMPRIHEIFSKGMHYMCDWLELHPESIRTARAFVELARSGSQNADTIMSELSMRLQAWDLQAIRATTFRDEIDIQSIITEPTLFVVELRESELKMLRPLANVIVVELLRYLTKYAEECPGQTLPRPVGLVIDEFASSLGRLPDIHVKLNTLRSRNVSVVAAIQSIGQIKGNYGEDWESVISGFSTKIFMPSLDYMDSEWASKESGIMTIRYRTSSKGQNRKITENFASRNVGSNEQLQQRAVLTPGEIGRPPGNQATFFLPETPVFQGHLTPYYKISDMRDRINEFNDPSKEPKLRQSPIDYKEELPEVTKKTDEGAKQRSDGTFIDPFSEESIWAALEELKEQELDWGNTTGDARKWWEAFEQENKLRAPLVLKVAQEIATRKASITDFFLAYVYSNSDNIQATFAYLDYTLHMKASQVAPSQQVENA